MPAALTEFLVEEGGDADDALRGGSVESSSMSYSSLRGSGSMRSSGMERSRSSFLRGLLERESSRCGAGRGGPGRSGSGHARQAG